MSDGWDMTAEDMKILTAELKSYSPPLCDIYMLPGNVVFMIGREDNGAVYLMALKTFIAMGGELPIPDCPPELIPHDFPTSAEE